MFLLFIETKCSVCGGVINADHRILESDGGPHLRIEPCQECIKQAVDRGYQEAMDHVRGKR